MQANRDEYVHYINTTPDAAATWQREGTGVESLSLEYNPQTETYKDITMRNSKTDFNGYQIASNVSDKRIDRDDPMYDFIKPYAFGAKYVETDYLFVDTADEVSEGVYRAFSCKILITINSFLSSTSTISYDVAVQGDLTVGTVTIADGLPTFTESAD